MYGERPGTSSVARVTRTHMPIAGAQDGKRLLDRTVPAAAVRAGTAFLGRKRLYWQREGLAVHGEQGLGHRDAKGGGKACCFPILYASSASTALVDRVPEQPDRMPP